MDGPTRWFWVDPERKKLSLIDVSQKTGDPSHFIFNGEALAYSQIRYNNLSERTVEIPVALSFLLRWLGRGVRGVRRPGDKRGPRKQVLEVGNTLRHYENHLSWVYDLGHRTIIDKYEEYEGVANIDLFDMPEDEEYDLIFSISSLEHVGQGETPDGQYGESGDASRVQRDREAPLQAIRKVYDLLAPGGHALITVPYGKLTDSGWWIQFSRAYLERMFTVYGVPREAVEVKALRRVGIETYNPNPWQKWLQENPDELDQVEFHHPGPHANAIAVIMLEKPDPKKGILAKLRRTKRQTLEMLMENGQPLVYANPVLIGDIFYNHFLFDATIDRNSGQMVRTGRGHIFWGPYIRLETGRYDLDVDISVREPECDLFLRVIGKRGEMICYEHRIRGDCSIRHSFTVTHHVDDLEITLENRHYEGVSMTVDRMVLRKRS